MKTHSGAKKRFKVTGSGKVKRFQANKRHILNKKSSKRKRRLSGSCLVDSANMGQVRRLLPNG